MSGRSVLKQRAPACAPALLWRHPRDGHAASAARGGGGARLALKAVLYVYALKVGLGREAARRASPSKP
jgi:hypothetical protein